MPGGLALRLRRRDNGADDFAVALRIDRQLVFEIPAGKTAGLGIVFQFDRQSRDTTVVFLLRVTTNVPFALQHVENGAAQFRVRAGNYFLAGFLTVPNSGQHIANWITE